MARTMENTVEAEAFRGSGQHLGRLAKLFWLYVGASSSWLSWLGPSMINRRYRNDPRRRGQAMSAYRNGINKGLLFAIAGLLAVLAVPALIGLSAAHFAGGSSAQQTGFGFTPSHITADPPSAPAVSSQAPSAQNQPAVSQPAPAAVSYDSQGYPIWQGQTAVITQGTGAPIWAYAQWQNCGQSIRAGSGSTPGGFIGAYSLTINGQSVPLGSVGQWSWPSSGSVQLIGLFSLYGPDPGDGSTPPLASWAIVKVTGTTGNWQDVEGYAGAPGISCSVLSVAPMK